MLVGENNRPILSDESKKSPEITLDPLKRFLLVSSSFSSVRYAVASPLRAIAIRTVPTHADKRRRPVAGLVFWNHPTATVRANLGSGNFQKLLRPYRRGLVSLRNEFQKRGDH